MLAISNALRMSLPMRQLNNFQDGQIVRRPYALSAQGCARSHTGTRCPVVRGIAGSVHKRANAAESSAFVAHRLAIGRLQQRGTDVAELVLGDNIGQPNVSSQPLLEESSDVRLCSQT